MTTIDDAAPAAFWTQVTYFQIYKYFASNSPETIGVFANGRQQCQIKVDFIARDDNGIPVTLSAADIENHLQLIDYGSGEVIGFAAAPGWKFSTKDSGFLWDESVIDEVRAARQVIPNASDDRAFPAHVSRPVPANVQQVTLYLSGNTARTLQVAAKLNYPNPGRPAAMTNVRSIPFNDPLGDGEGQFNSMVFVDGVVGPSLTTQDYGDRNFDGSLTVQPVGNQNHFFQAFQHRINVNFRGRRFPLYSVSGSPDAGAGFAVYKYGPYLETWKWAMSYYGQPNASSPEHFPLPPLNYVDVTGRSEPWVSHAPDPATHDVSRLAIASIARIALAAMGASERQESDESVAAIEPHTAYYPLQMLAQCEGGIQPPSADTVVVGLLAGKLAGRFKTSTGLETQEVTTTMLYLMDAYGNKHALRLGFGSSLTQLTLTKA